MMAFILSFLGVCLLGLVFGCINAWIYWLAYNNVLQPLLYQVFELNLPNVGYGCIFILTFLWAVFTSKVSTQKCDMKDGWIAVFSNIVTKFIYLILAMFLFNICYGC